MNENEPKPDYTDEPYDKDSCNNRLRDEDNWPVVNVYCRAGYLLSIYGQPVPNRPAVPPAVPIELDCMGVAGVFELLSARASVLP